MIMSERICNRQRQLMANLADKYEFARWIESIKYKPGDAILALSDKEREILKDLTSSDITDVVWPKVYDIKQEKKS